MYMQRLGLGGPRVQWRKTVLATAMAAAAMPAWAGDTINLGADTTLDYHVTVGYGIGLRTRSPSDALLTPDNINGDDGNRNFKKGSLIQNQVNLLAEGDLKHGDLGFFTRVSSFYDQVYHRSNYNNAPDTVNQPGPFNEFTPTARRYLGGRTKLLSAYAYDTFKLGSTELNVKLGEQVVAWGESLFFGNIAAAQGPADAVKGYVAGAEVKDILLPTPQLSMQWNLTPNFSVLGYYQFQFRPNELVPQGGYFSYADIIGPGSPFMIGPGGMQIPRGPDILPKNRNQWGVGTRWRAEQGTEFGFYHLHYNDTSPNVITSFFPTLQYQQQYFTNIALTGASFSTDLGGINVAGETSYRNGAAVLLNTGDGPLPTRGNVWQSNLSAIYTVGPTFLAASQSLVGEISYVHVTGFTPLQGSTELTNTRGAAAYAINWTLSYKNVFDGWDLDVPLTYSHQFSGNTSLAGSLGSLTGVGDTQLSAGLTFTYMSNLKLGLVYAKYLGTANPVTRPLADRDYVLATATYSF
ncbi:hypothetical protein PTE30175_03622 [Pandoraea terrae]|uniref:DUF1302 domain-containing protein n=1 Tax=Pandoraea terrae TaxID=1537710 RepID=A0A5E4X807_9BURK|nr:DUF1302 family protein [Pandoraea terrae]VVE32340.1 hypothetical protein PTE30175_03622 [Pandoraea terrae]